MTKVTLTKGLIEAGRTGNSGYTAKQIKALGLSYPPSKGWLLSLIGTDISTENYERFLNRATKTQANAYLDGKKKTTKRARKLAGKIKVERELDMQQLENLDKFKN